MNAIARYLQEFATRFGNGWNRFWFAPSDPYTTSVMRILVGGVATLWLTAWTFDLQRLFGPQGWLPLAAMQQWRGDRGFTVLDLAGNPTVLWLIQALALAAAVMFTIGLFTRITSVLTAIFLISYMWRGPLLYGEMESILAMLVVYLCLGPCGAELSLDRWRAQRRARQNLALARPSTDESRLSSAATVSTRLLQIHLTAIFVAMALAKCRGQVWWTGEAVWWMGARPDSRMIDFASLLAGKLELVNLATHTILLFEFTFALLVWPRITRPMMLALSLPFWIAIALLTGLVGYSFLMLVAGMAFVSPQFLRSYGDNCCQGQASTDEIAPPPSRRNEPVAAGS